MGDSYHFGNLIGLIASSIVRKDGDAVRSRTEPRNALAISDDVVQLVVIRILHAGQLIFSAQIATAALLCQYREGRRVESVELSSGAGLSNDAGHYWIFWIRIAV